MAGEPAAQPDLDAPEGKIDLVVDRDHALQRYAQGPTRRADGVTRFVHVGLRQQHAYPGAARAGSPVRVEGAVLLLRARQPPVLRRQRGDLEADVVARARVAVPGVAEPHDEPIDLAGAVSAAAPVSAARAAEQPQEPSPSSEASPSPSAGASASSAGTSSPSGTSSPTSSVSSSISSGSSISVGT